LRQGPQLAEDFCFFFSKKKRLLQFLTFASLACVASFNNTILGRVFGSGGQAWMAGSSPAMTMKTPGASNLQALRLGGIVGYVTILFANRGRLG
jgi:hypothetical protein